MERIPVIAVFDVGKTNKKLLLFNEQYQVVYERSEQLAETSDDDGDPCEDVVLLTCWLKERMASVLADKRFNVKALSFSAYGASFVYLDENGEVTAPLYNYLKSCPREFEKKFYRNNGKQIELCVSTASPALGSLNSGLQLYRIKLEKPDLYKRIRYALHLPQYLSYVFSGFPLTEITSIGCHTHLWDFTRNEYHEWVQRSGLIRKFAPLTKDIVAGTYEGIAVGVGYHDSSAALVPYRKQFLGPFVLLSTGTWCISMNPFDRRPLTIEDFAADCLCYMSPDGLPVKASRYFSGHEYGQITANLKQRFKVTEEEIRSVEFNTSYMPEPTVAGSRTEGNSTFVFEEYHGLNFIQTHHLNMHHMITMLKQKVDRVLTSDTRDIYVDGGFSQNKLFMQMLALAYPGHRVYSSTVPQASAIGAAMMMHEVWNPKPLRSVIDTLPWNS